MNEEAMNKAFEAIHDKALELLQYDLPKEVNDGLRLIVSLARYQHDVRTDEERRKPEERRNE